MTGLVGGIVRAEHDVPGRYADRVRRDWGMIYVTPTIRDSHDGNNARILKRSGDLGGIIDEIVGFYRDRDLAPRVTHVGSDDGADLRATLTAAGFSFGEEPARFYVRRAASRIAPVGEVRVRQVEKVDDGLFPGLVALHNARMAKVTRRRAPHDDAWLFVGEIDGEVASIALLERFDGVCRIDEVHTAERFRRRGCCSAVIHALVTFHEENLAEPIYLWTDCPEAERIYEKAGFVPLDAPICSWGAGIEE